MAKGEGGLVILSRGRGYLFIHIPKTGGTALSMVLEARAMKEDILVGDTPKARARRGRLAGIRTEGRLWKHATLADLGGLVGPGEAAELFIFALVRNPWDRVVSYYHWLQEQRFDHPAVALAKGLGFSAFLNHSQTRESLRAWPYGRYLADKNGQERCRLWIRLEHFAEDVRPLEAHLGFALAPLPRANASARGGDYRLHYTEGDHDLVASLCSADIARFGYRFG